MSQGNVARHVSTECDTKLACCKAMWLGMRVPKVCCKAMWLGNVARHKGAESDTKLACHKAMWLGT
ncbi:unnamed protein product [Prunus armeniaca]